MKSSGRWHPNLRYISICILSLALQSWLNAKFLSPDHISISSTCACDPTADRLALIALYDSTGGANWKNFWNLDLAMDNWYGVQLNEDGCVISLKLSENELSGTLPNLNLPYLERLEVHKNALHGKIPNFSGLPSLQWLDCSFNNFEDTIPNFTGLPDLYALWCGKNELSGSIPDFDGLPNLKFFSCGDNRQAETYPTFPNFRSWSILTVK